MSATFAPGADTRSLHLAVAGEVGPALRSALRPLTVVRAEQCTVLRLGTSSDVDVLSVMEALDSAGLRVTGVRCVSGETRAGAPDRVVGA